MSTPSLAQLRDDEYELGRTAVRMRQEVFSGAADAAAISELRQAEEALVSVEAKRGELEKEQGLGRVISSESASHLLGAESTGLVATVDLRMSQIPTAIYHLLRGHEDPLVSGTIKNQSDKRIRRLRVRTRIEGYSVDAIDTFEIRQDESASFEQLPTLIPELARSLDELARASVSVLVEDLDTSGTGVEVHRTEPIWMLARTTAPFAVRDPGNGRWRDLTKYFGAFVTPNDPAVMEFLARVRDAHPDRRLVGYQEGAIGTEKQVRAIYSAIQATGAGYVNSTTAFSPDDGAVVQRVRLPAETLKTTNANCIDGTVLFASLIESLSMNAAIVTMPGHAIVAWEVERGSNRWQYLDTVVVGAGDFDAARERGGQLATPLEPLFGPDNPKYHRWSIRELRAMGITPTH